MSIFARLIGAKTLFFLLILYTSTLLAIDVTFDISTKGDFYNIIEHLEYNKDVVERTYIPHSDCKIKRIIDGNEILWDAEPGTECGNLTVFALGSERKMLSIRVMTASGSEFIWMERFRSHWRFMADEEFGKCWYQLHHGRELKLEDPHSHTFKAEECKSIYGKGLRIMPILDYKIRSVTCLGEELWSSDELDCEFVIVYGDFTDPRWVSITINFGGIYHTVYFQRTAIEWKTRSFEEFSEEIKRARIYSDDPGEGCSYVTHFYRHSAPRRSAVRTGTNTAEANAGHWNFINYTEEEIKDLYYECASGQRE
ncbi:signal peptide containing protein [Theileria equi strain WA]|uniref:Signal peptide containing protein n=1 Tax=Theileria equi strain WA TaxID=1537102 RepID=L1LA97_THEEQ|nr:signal peptide containing protein [Theileria equi strain WA]EKX72170.1 signal peptide containing protein [Theileria equi strain WA]|eukprot:XP_004831622.1 signal peptide containing protein [Theileria equi strain WA]